MKNKNKVIKRKGIGVSVNFYEKLISEKGRAVPQFVKLPFYIAIHVKKSSFLLRMFPRFS
jgi:hypothetical protein